LTVSGTLTAKPKLNTFEELHQMNRFLNQNLRLRHSYVAELGGEIRFEYYEGSSLYASVSYMSAANYGYFEKADLPVITGGTPVPKGYYTVSYGDANRMRGSAGLNHQLVPEKFWIHAEAYIQEPKLEDGRRIPYEEQWGLNSGVSLQPVKKLTLEGWADYIGERSTVSSGDLGGFLKVGSQVEVQVSEKIGVYARLLNLLNQEYEIWSGYQERPFQAYGGITIKLN
ncbi:MAG: hypothetical protein R3224_06350, partial [Balneolaceae bacterium]|nr:hypothetical protein [Balneolaceae bacterium]